jgi:hypothetical protein
LAYNYYVSYRWSVIGEYSHLLQSKHDMLVAANNGQASTTMKLEYPLDTVKAVHALEKKCADVVAEYLGFNSQIDPERNLEVIKIAIFMVLKLTGEPDDQHDHQDCTPIVPSPESSMAE